MLPESQKFKDFQWGYRTRVMASIIVLLLAVFISLVLYGIITDRNILRDHLQSTGEYLVRNLAQNSETGVFSESVSFLQAPLAAIHGKEEVVWAAVYSSEAELIKSVSDQEHMITPLPIEIKQWFHDADYETTTSRVSRTNGMQIIEYFAPIYLQQNAYVNDGFENDENSDFDHEIIGLARVGITLESLDARTREIVGTASLLGVVYVFVGIFAIFFIQRAVATPIKIVAASALEIGNGNLTRRIHVTTHDEIGELADAFNHMAEQLQQAMLERRQNEHQREKLLRDLESKNKELEGIVYVASHDLRSPLVNIQGFGNELSMSCEDLAREFESHLPPDGMQRLHAIIYEDIPQSLKYIQSGAYRMDIILKGLLRLSRLGQAGLRIERLDMNALMQKIIDSLKFQIQEADASVAIESLPECFGDFLQVAQIFSNLIDNALKYLDKSREGHITISGDVQGNTCRYCVADNGIGIHPDHQDKIFQIFHRLNPGDEVQGEGLGLAIVQRIVNRLGGALWLESVLGVGSTFYVSLPAVFEGEL